MSRVAKGIEVATNVAVLVVCFLLTVSLVRSTASGNVRAVSASPLVGSKLNIGGASWGASRKTVVLAMSTECHFCKESTPFYKRLLSVASSRHDRVMAAFPQSELVSKDYLEKEQLGVDEVKQIPLDSIRVSGTPTLMIVDTSGTILKSWVGKLTPAAEAEVVNAL